MKPSAMEVASMVTLITMVSQSMIFLMAQGAASKCTETKCTATNCTVSNCTGTNCTVSKCNVSKCTGRNCNVSKCTGPKCNVSKCTVPRGIYWNYDRNGFAFVVKDSNRDTILYYTSDLKFIEEEANFLEIESNSGVFSLPKNTNVTQGENVRVVRRGETKIVVISGDEACGATYHDSSKDTLFLYRSILVHLTTGKVVSYSEEEATSGRVPWKIQFNVTSSPNDVFLVLWGDGQFYSSQPLETIDGNGGRFVIDTERYSYFHVNLLSGCGREACLDSTIDSAVFKDGKLLILANDPHPDRADCTSPSAAFGYKGHIWLLYPDPSCNHESIISLMNPLLIGFEMRDIVAAMTINDTLYLITKQEVAMVRIKLGHEGSIVPVSFMGKKSKNQVWPGIPDNVDAAFYNETNGLTYFVDREYQMMFKKSERVSGGFLVPNIGTLFECSSYDYERSTGKLFGAKSMEEYVRVIVKKRQGCGDSCPDSVPVSGVEETDKAVLVITLAVVATILILSIIVLVVILFITKRRRKEMNDMSTVGNSLWNSDMTDIRTVKSRGQNDVTIKGVPKRKR